MSFKLTPPDREEGAETLMSLGLYGFTRSGGSYYLSKKPRKVRDPKTGAIVEYRPEELLTLDIRKKLEGRRWSVVHSSASQWRSTFQG
jgi:hypothetical protein